LAHNSQCSFFFKFPASANQKHNRTRQNPVYN
jgi:hypothetical protein